MKRTIEQWRNCDPAHMATAMSPAAIRFALEDAKADILELHQQLQYAQQALTGERTRGVHASSMPHHPRT